jgi:hypothetical protein
MFIYIILMGFFPVLACFSKFGPLWALPLRQHQFAFHPDSIADSKAVHKNNPSGDSIGAYKCGIIIEPLTH